MQRKAFFQFVFVCAVVLAAASFLLAQQVNLSDASYRRAREVLEAARKAHSPSGTLPGIDDLSFKITGQLYARDQSPLTTSADALPMAGQLILDFPQKRVLFDARADFPGGFPVRQRILLHGDEGKILNTQQKTMGPLPVPAVSRELLLSRVPQALIAGVFERAASLRWIGEADFDGKKQNVIAYATANGAQTYLYFDARTNLLTKTETLGTDPVSGDAVTENIVVGYLTIGGIPFPTGHIRKIAGQLSLDYRYSDIRVNSHPADATFEPPADFTTTQQVPNLPLEVKELAKDVYLVQGLGGGTHAAMFVAFNDHVMVLEPVLNEGASRQVMDKVKQTVPGKPIRYIVATHHHSDHIGGVRTYLAEGVTLVTTPGNVDYFQKTAAARFTLPPDAMQLKPRTPAIETVQNKKRVFTDGTHTVELIDVGPNPHVKEFVVVWLPKERILFGGDIFARNVDRSLVPANSATLQLVEALERLGLNVERLVDVHSLVNTMEDVRQAIDLSRKSSSTQPAGNR